MHYCCKSSFIHMRYINENNFNFSPSMDDLPFLTWQIKKLRFLNLKNTHTLHNDSHTPPSTYIGLKVKTNQNR